MPAAPAELAGEFGPGDHVTVDFDEASRSFRFDARRAESFDEAA